MPAIKRFEDIRAWKIGRELTRQIYLLSDQGKFSRDFSFRDQIRRASVSVMSNIAEGFESETQALFITYLGRARASAGELRSHLYIASDLEYISEKQFHLLMKQLQSCSRHIYRFSQYLRTLPNTRRIKD